MKPLFLALTLILAISPAARAWAIILSQPKLQYVGGGKRELLKSVEAEMAKLEFEGGIINVSAPCPQRNLRFGAPGQDANELLPLLAELGFKVTVSFSGSLPENRGIIIAQKEDGSRNLSVLINTKHPRFELDQFKLTYGPRSEQPAPTVR